MLSPFFPHATVHLPSYEEETVGEDPITPSGGAPPTAGPQLMGLLCPKCRQMCQGVQALKEHMQAGHFLPC